MNTHTQRVELNTLLTGWLWVKATMQVLKQRILMLWLFYFNPVFRDDR